MPSQNKLGAGRAPQTLLAFGINASLDEPQAGSSDTHTAGTFDTTNFSNVICLFQSIAAPSAGVFHLNCVTRIGDDNRLLPVTGYFTLFLSRTTLTWHGQTGGSTSSALQAPVISAVSSTGIPSDHPLAPNIVTSPNSSTGRWVTALGDQTSIVFSGSLVSTTGGLFNYWIWGMRN